jgi:hypothetical protein
MTPYSPSVLCVMKGQNLNISYYTIIYNIRESNIVHTGLQLVLENYSLHAATIHWYFTVPFYKNINSIMNPNIPYT